MNHYQQRLIIDASPAAVYAALSTQEGLRGWWTEDCTAGSEVGSELQFRFGPSYKHMRVERLAPQREVGWRCTVAHIAVDGLKRRDEWLGTQIVFRLQPAGEGRTQLDFEHVGLEPGLECYALCEQGWQHFMRSLAQFAATGKGTPYVPQVAAACAGSQKAA